MLPMRTALRCALAIGGLLGACSSADDTPAGSGQDSGTNHGGSTSVSGAGKGGSSGSSATGGPDGGAGKGGSGSAGNAGKGGGSAGTAGSLSGSGGSGGGSGSSAGTGGASAGTGSHDDAGTADCAPCIEDELGWGQNGGFVAFVDQSELAPCNAYHHLRVGPGGGGTPQLTCERQVPCMGSGVHGIADVIQALAHPDVQAAFAKGMVLFGQDGRPSDGQVFEIVLGKDIIDVGTPCGAGGGCTAVPAGVNALVELLHAIDDEQLNLSPCREVFRQ